MEDLKEYFTWSKISTTLAGHEASISKNRIPKVHQEKINELLSYMKEWKDKYQRR